MGGHVLLFYGRLVTLVLLHFSDDISESVRGLTCTAMFRGIEASAVQKRLPVVRIRTDGIRTELTLNCIN